MDWMNIIAAVLSLGLMGLLFGAVLAVASRVFEVKTDERIPQIIESLPGANCGGCGFAGCSAYANAIVEGKAGCGCCPVGGEEAAKKIAGIMGLTAEKQTRMCAAVHCCGTGSATAKKYTYRGIGDCNAVMRLGGGEKACPYSCTGLGNCARACKFDAMHIVDGVACVDRAKCTACGMCVASCPKGLVELVPYDNPYYVGCSNRDKGVLTKNDCTVGCIACRMCEKACEQDAIHVMDNRARIDYHKCIGCGACAEKCPKKIIRAAGN